MVLAKLPHQGIQEIRNQSSHWVTVLQDNNLSN